MLRETDLRWDQNRLHDAGVSSYPHLLLVSGCRQCTVRTNHSRDGDEDILKELSAETILERKIDTESLLERLLHGFKFWSEKKKHLDVKSVTLCASSRYSDGGVPSVDRDSDSDVDVGRHGARCSDPAFRARRAVR